MKKVKSRATNKLLESARQASEIVRGERAPSREFPVDCDVVKELRAKMNLSQARFAELLSVELGTLRNWEQGRREPTDLRERCCARSRRTRRTC